MGSEWEHGVRTNAHLKMADIDALVWQSELALAVALAVDKLAFVDGTVGILHAPVGAVHAALHKVASVDPEGCLELALAVHLPLDKLAPAETWAQQE